METVKMAQETKYLRVYDCAELVLLGMAGCELPMQPLHTALGQLLSDRTEAKDAVTS